MLRVEHTRTHKGEQEGVAEEGEYLAEVKREEGFNSLLLQNFCVLYLLV